jgi:REP element-mobilizing transposase RayT
MEPRRKSPIHLPIVETFNRPIVVFITVCSQGRKSIFCQPDVHQLLIDAWRRADSWQVGRYVIMPNHIHLFCSPAEPDFPELKNWVCYWKSISSRSWPRRDEQPIWQRSFWDTQMRKGKNYEEKWEYVRQNPVRGGLCHIPEAWPYRGELNVIEWFG